MFIISTLHTHRKPIFSILICIFTQSAKIYHSNKKISRLIWNYWFSFLCIFMPSDYKHLAQHFFLYAIVVAQLFRLHFTYIVILIWLLYLHLYSLWMLAKLTIRFHNIFSSRNLNIPSSCTLLQRSFVFRLREENTNGNYISYVSYGINNMIQVHSSIEVTVQNIYMPHTLTK